MQLLRPATWPAAQPSDRLRRINALLEHYGVVPVRSTDQHHQGDALHVYNDVPLATELASVRGVGACFLAPRGLGTDESSMLARLQSI